jgi:hypothetical protein
MICSTEVNRYMKFDCKREEEYKTLFRKKGGPAHIRRKKCIDTDCGKKDLKRLVERRKMARKGESYIKRDIKGLWELKGRIQKFARGNKTREI